MPESEPIPEAEAPKGLLGPVRAWASGSKSRNYLVLGAFAVAAVATVGLWVSATEIVTEDEASIGRAFEALDKGDDDLARSLIAEIQRREDLSAFDFGSILYVLGALKIGEADRQWSPDRARTDFYIASKYLDEGRTIGFPEGRVTDGLLLLGRSLVESHQNQRGIEILREAIAVGARGMGRAHLLLAQAYFYAPRPDFVGTVEQIDAALAAPDLTAEERSRALLLKSEALAALERGDEALAAAREAAPNITPARRALVEGKALVTVLEDASGPERARLAAEAEAALAQARRADKLSTSVTRQSDFLRARIAELIGQRETARLEYEKLWRSDGASSAGVAAALSHAAMQQENGDDEAALDAYRRALDAIGEPTTYRSNLLPLSEVNLRVRTAHTKYLRKGDYDSALQLTEWVGSLFGEQERLALKANTLKQWGEDEVEAAELQGARGKKRLHEGRRRLREAGIAYEQLAESRFSTASFSDDLWNAAETLLEGHAYGESIRVLDRYLRHEPVERNALVLLRLGEAHLARSEDKAAISAFEECLEFHPQDAASFAARLECAKAYRLGGELGKAESLLRENLTRTALTPASPEWRDSKFELGRLLNEAGRNDEAIRELEEAVKRYPEDPQSLSARYYIAMAHREAAREPLERLRAAVTISEQEVARNEAEVHLNAALDMFQEVQNEIIRSASGDLLDRVTLRNCFMLGGDVLFELGSYDEARQAYSNVSTLYQNEPFMLEAFVAIYHCWRREKDRPKALGVVQQARLLLDRLPDDAEFDTSTNLTRAEWDALLTQLASF